MIKSVRQFLSFTTLLALPLSGQAAIKPVVAFDFGGATGNIAEELFGVGNLYLTPKNEVVLVNAKPLELRVYDQKGKLLRKIGRTGGGPGEYQQTLNFAPWKGDTILARTNGTRRWILFSIAGKLLREWPIDSLNPSPAVNLLESWGFAQATVIGTGGCLSTTIRKLPAGTPWTPRLVTTDAAGRLWVRNTETEWRIYSVNGESLAKVELPASFNIKQFNGDLVVGSRTDDDGDSHVTAYRVTLPPAGSITPCPTEPPAGPRVDELKRTLANMRTAAEAHWSETKSYPTTVPTKFITLPEGMEMTLMQASAKGYAALLTDKKSPYRCFMSMNTTMLPSMFDGSIICGK